MQIEPPFPAPNPSPEPDTVLVIGGSGFLGAHVLDALVRRNTGRRIVSASRHPAAGPLPPGVRIAIEGEPIDAVRHASHVRETLDRLAPGWIVLCSALSRAADCEAQPDLADRMNRDFPGTVAAWCSERSARLVHVSTDLVFGRSPAPEGGFREEDTPEPLGEYGRSKLEGEGAVLEACPGAAVVRLPLLYGSSLGRGLGASDSLLAAIARGESPALFEDEWRTPLAAEDAGAGLVELLASNLRGVIHLGGPERLTRYELGLEVLRAAGRSEDEARASVTRARRAEVDAGAPRAEDVSLSSEHFEASCGTPRRPVLEALADSGGDDRRRTAP